MLAVVTIPSALAEKAFVRLPIVIGLLHYSSLKGVSYKYQVRQFSNFQRTDELLEVLLDQYCSNICTLDCKIST